MREHIKSIVISALALTVICAVVTAALAGTNLLTKDTIAQQEADAMTAACAQVIDADGFAEKTLTDSEGGTVTYYEATKAGSPVGYVFSATVTGKSSGMVVMTGVDASGVVTGVAVTANSETAGYIDKITKGGLFDRLTGASADTLQDVDAVSQATKSSTGVKKGVAQALTYFEEVSSNG